MKKKLITVQTAEYIALREILIQVQSAFEEGWRLPHDMDCNEFFPKKVASGYYEVVLVKENEAEMTGYEADMLSLDILSKKDELLSFAAMKGITIPEEIKIPTAITKYMKNYITENKETIYGTRQPAADTGTDSPTMEGDMWLGLTDSADEQLGGKTGTV